MDAMSLPANEFCPIARALDVVGQKWNLLLLREASFGRRRFAEFQRIGIPAATLGQRLESLVDSGLLERRSYREDGERAREEYVLTGAGRDILVVLAALGDWGHTHRPAEHGPGVTFTAAGTGRPVRLAFVDDRGELVDRDAVTVTVGPLTR
jgi:DNA-binding HxlR family transcriptional regulator